MDEKIPRLERTAIEEENKDRALEAVDELKDILSKADNQEKDIVEIALMWIARIANIYEARCEALDAIRTPKYLKKIAEYCIDEVALRALERLKEFWEEVHDAEMRKEIEEIIFSLGLYGSRDKSVSEKAIDMICHIWDNTQSQERREEIEERIFSLVLYGSGDNSVSEKVREMICHIWDNTQSQERREEIEDRIISVFNKCMSRQNIYWTNIILKILEEKIDILSEKALKIVAIYERDSSKAKEAVDRIHEDDSLAGVVIRTQNEEVAKRAVSRVNSESALRQIIKYCIRSMDESTEMMNHHGDNHQMDAINEFRWFEMIKSHAEERLKQLRDKRKGAEGKMEKRSTGTNRKNKQNL